MRKPSITFVATAIGGIFAVPSHPDFLKPAPLSMILIMAGFGAFAPLFLNAVHRLPAHKSTDSAETTWIKQTLAYPSSTAGLQFTGLVFLGGGFGALTRGLYSQPTNWFFELPLSLAIGMLASVYFLKRHPARDGSDE